MVEWLQDEGDKSMKQQRPKTQRKSTYTPPVYRNVSLKDVFDWRSLNPRERKNWWELVNEKASVIYIPVCILLLVCGGWAVLAPFVALWEGIKWLDTH